MNIFLRNNTKLAKKIKSKKAFTIIELLLVIVIIGVLATIITISYIGINEKASIATLQLDLNNSAKQLKLYNVDFGYYPASLSETESGSGRYCPPEQDADKYCLKFTESNEFYEYSRPSNNAFTLKLQNGNFIWMISESGQPIDVSEQELNANKYVFTGGSTTNSSLNIYSHQENLVRDSHGGLHIVYNDLNAPATSYYINSSDNGLTWSSPETLYSTTNQFNHQSDIKIDSNDRLHFTTPEYSSDYLRVQHRYKNYGESWSGVTTLGLQHYNDEVMYAPSPDIDTSNNVHIIFDRTHYRGVGYKSWNGSWSATSGVLSAGYDFAWQKTLSIGSNLYMFFAKFYSPSDMYMVKRVNGTWSMSSSLTSFNSRYHDEVVDSDGNIWVFVTDVTNTPYKTYYRKYTVSSGSWGTLTLLDSDATYHVAYPSATVDSVGNIYTFYAMNDNQWQIYYKIFDKSTGIWSERRQFTNSAEHGSAVFPRVRYQASNQVEKDIIELTYRQNNIGSTTYNLYYGRLTNP